MKQISKDEWKKKKEIIKVLKTVPNSKKCHSSVEKKKRVLKNLFALNKMQQVIWQANPKDKYSKIPKV